MSIPDLTAYDAVVYDLDGTLVELAVNWAAVRTDVGELFASHGVDAEPVDWGMLDVAAEYGLRERVEATIADHEVEGASESHRLPLADDLVSRTVPAAVCSLNSERSCRVALDEHGLAGHVDAVVGRDSVETRKPDPEPLLAALAPLGVDPDRAVFVGDSPSDARTAARAGVDFRAVPGSDADG